MRLRNVGMKILKENFESKNIWWDFVKKKIVANLSNENSRLVL